VLDADGNMRLRQRVVAAALARQIEGRYVDSPDCGPRAKRAARGSVLLGEAGNRFEVEQLLRRKGSRSSFP